MVPRKFNIVDFGGFDLASQYGEVLPGIYDKIVDAHWNCVYIMCFGLKFGGFDIAPQYMTPEMFSDHVMLNGIISIDQNDVITVPSIEPPVPPPVPPVIQPLDVAENGTYLVPEGTDGFNPVVVNVPAGSEDFSSSLVPIVTDFKGGYVAGSIWYAERYDPSRTDIYQVEAHKRYIVLLGSTYGNRFRVAFFNTNPAEATSNLTGVNLGEISPSRAYVSEQPYYTQSSGYIAVGKSNNNVTGIPSYVFEVLF
jgi:hypothetical protein